MSALSMPTEELLALYAAFVNEWIPQKRAELQAQKTRLATAGKKAQPGEEKTPQAPAWLFGTGKPQGTDEPIASAAAMIAAIDSPMTTIPVEPDQTAAEPLVEEPIRDGGDDEPAGVDAELEASPVVKSEDGWL